MRLLALLLLSVAIVQAGCDKSSSKPVPSNPNTLHLDDAHNQAAGTNADFYLIAPSQSLEVDARGYTIPVPKQFPAAGPNSVHLIHGNDEYFRAAWDGKTPVLLAADGLRNIRGNSSFAGFRAGETYVLGVGHDNFPEREMKFEVMWAAMIKVSFAAQAGGATNAAPPRR